MKAKFQMVLLPILKTLNKLDVTANQITISAIVLSGITGVAFWFHPQGYMFLLVPIALLLRMALNALDGMMAKTYNQQSLKGEILNELGDVVSDALLYIPLVKLSAGNPLPVFVFVAIAIINEFAGILAKVVYGVRSYTGPMGKSDRAFVIGLFCLICYFYPQAIAYTTTVLLFASLLAVVSTIKRLIKTTK